MLLYRKAEIWQMGENSISLPTGATAALYFRYSEVLQNWSEKPNIYTLLFYPVYWSTHFGNFRINHRANTAPSQVSGSFVCMFKSSIELSKIDIKEIPTLVANGMIPWHFSKKFCCKMSGWAENVAGGEETPPASIFHIPQYLHERGDEKSVGKDGYTSQKQYLTRF